MKRINFEPTITLDTVIAALVAAGLLAGAYAKINADIADVARASELGDAQSELRDADLMAKTTRLGELLDSMEQRVRDGERWRDQASPEWRSSVDEK